MKRFQDGLVRADWRQSLDCCTTDVRAAASRHESPEAFLRAVVPIERMTLLGRFPISGMRTSPGQPDRVDNYYQSFVGILDGSDEMGIDWTWRAVKTPAGWQVDFQTAPLAEYVQQEIASRYARAQERRAAQVKLAPKFLAVHTRLRATAERFRLGEPILLRLELVNGSDAELVYDDQQVGVNDPLRVTDDQGNEIPYAMGPVQTGGAYVKLRAGGVAVLFDRFDLTKQYPITRPGRYTIQFRGGGVDVGIEDPALTLQSSKIVRVARSWPSNVVTVEVLK